MTADAFGSGTEQGDNEARQERKAEQKLLFQPMRKWYSDARNVALQAAHGLFPSMWMELEAWDGWKDARKAYLKFQDTGAWAGATSAADRAPAPERAAVEVAPAAAAPEAAAAASSSTAADAGVDIEMLRELHGPMGAWYSAKPELVIAHGLYPESAEGLESWPAFQAITKLFLDDGTPAERRRPRKKSRFAPRDATTVENVEPKTAESERLLRARAIQAGPGGGALALLQGSALALRSSGALLGGAPRLTQEQQQELMLLQMRLRTLQERSMNFAAEYEKYLRDPDREDPAPIYGPDGVRANTPEVLFRQELTRERTNLMAAIGKIQPAAATALGDAPKKPTRKLYIPIKEYPNVCFMGLILGPRGNHHKRMEATTGCKIRIRGKGSLREGSRGKDAQRDSEDDKDEMHVYVEGPTEAAVQQAVDEIEPLLNPESAAVDSLKEKHQTELAEINGTQRQEAFCHICGEKGHMQWECPAKQRSYAMANVRCALCGDCSHPTRDCALNKANAAAPEAPGDAPPGGAADATAARVKVDSEFLDFMSELGEEPGLGFQKPPPGVPPAMAPPKPVSVFQPVAPASSAAPPRPPPPAGYQATQQQRAYPPGYAPPPPPQTQTYYPGSQYPYQQR